MTPSVSENDNIESFHLALKPDTPLFLSLHQNVSRPHDYFEASRAHQNLAIMDASRIISVGQLVAAANMAVIRNSKQTLAWDTVFQAASSSHVGHVLRDNSFGEESPDEATIVVLAVGGTIQEFQGALKEVGFQNPSPGVSAYLNRPRSPQETANFIKRYKLTSDEVSMSSLEDAVLTRISTKYV